MSLICCFQLVGCKKISKVDPNIYGKWTMDFNNNSCHFDLTILENNRGSVYVGGNTDDCKRNTRHHIKGDKKIYLRGDYLHIGKIIYKIVEYPNVTEILPNGIKKWSMMIEENRNHVFFNQVEGRLYKYSN